MTNFEAEYSKSREDTLMDVSRLQARAKTTERKAVGVAEEVAAARAMALSEYQSSVEFQ